MLDSIVVLAGLFGVPAVLLTAKAMDMFKPSTVFAKYAIAGLVSTGLIAAGRFVGDVGLPDISGLSLFNLAILDVLVFGMAGGFWDALKLVGIRK